MSTTAADVFLSYSHADAPAVRQIQAYLKQAGLATFLDRDQLPAGQPWLPALEHGIARCTAVIVLVGPAGLGTWQQREVQLALDRQAEAERAGRAFPVIPVLLPKVEDPPGGFLHLQTWVDLRADLADPTQLHLLLSGLRGHAPADSSAVREAVCPYRGLLPFREEDAGLFFGREDAIDTLLDKLRDHSLVTLVGRSGSGKSSVVSAGLIPALRRRADGRTWSLLTLRPGPEPLHALVRLFDPPPVDLPPFTADQRVEQQVTILRTDDDALGRRIRSFLTTPDETGTDRLLLCVDQWEELYTQALRHPALVPEPAEREVTRFIDLLLAATRTSPCTVVLTVRADFYSELLKHGPLAAAVQAGLVNLGPMRREGLKAAIKQPAEAVGLTVDLPLLEALVDEVSADLGKLPLLEYALKETWRRREGQRLTLTAYGQAGGIDGAVAQRANQIFTSLSQAQQGAARRLFVSLVTPGEGREDTRAPAVYPEQDDAIAAVINKFSAADARLLVTGEDIEDVSSDVPSARRLVEISHEALIREWDLLQAWIETNREALRRRDHIRARLRQWEEQGRDPTLLLPPGLPLEEGRKLLADHGDVLIDEVQPYIAASITADRAREKAARAAEQRRLNRARLVASVMAVLLGAAIVLSYFVYDRGIEVDRQRQRVTAQNLAAQAALLAERGRDADAIERAAALAVESWRHMENSQATEAASKLVKMLPSVVVEGGDKDKFIPTSDGRYFATGNDNGVTRLFAAENGKEIANIKQGGAIHDIAFSPDGRWLATRNDDIWLASRTGGAMRIIDVANGREVASAEHGGKTWENIFSRDGQFFATLDPEEGVVRLYTLVGGREIALELGGKITNCAFSPDGQVLATAGEDGTARFISTVNGREITRIAQSGPLTKVAFSPDGRFFATLESNSGSVRVFEGISDREVGRIASGEAISSLAFSRDSRKLATGDRGGTVQLIELATRQEVARISHSAPIFAVGFSPDGRLLAVFSNDGLARFLDANTGKEFTRVEHRKLLPWFRYSYDVRHFFTANYEGTGQLIDAASKREIARMEHGAYISAVNFSFDNRLLATGSEDGVVRLFNAENGEEVGKIKHGGSISKLGGIAFSRDNRLIAAASEDGIVGLIDKVSGREVRRFALDGPVSSVEFSPDGRFLVAESEKIVSFKPLESEGKTTRLFSVPDGREVLRVKNTLPEFLFGFGAEILSSDDRRLAFSPDSRLLATASGETLRVIEAASGKEISRSAAPDGLINKIGFSPNGRWVAAWVFFAPPKGSAETVQEVRLIDVETGRESGRVEGIKYPVSFVFSEDSHFLAVSDQTRVALYDTLSGKIVAHIQHEKQIKDLAFSPDGQILATGDEGGTVLLTETQNGQHAARIKRDARVVDITFSADGKTVFIAYSDKVSVVEVASGQEKSDFKYPEIYASLAVFSSPGQQRWLAIADLDGTVKLVDGDITRMEHSRHITDIAFASDGRSLITRSEGGKVRVFRVAESRELAHIEQSGPLSHLSISNDSRYMATQTASGRVRLTELESGREVAQIEPGEGIFAVDFSPDGRLLAIGDRDGSVRVIETSTGRESVRMEQQGEISNLAFSPDGSMLASGGDNNLVVVVEPATGREITRIQLGGEAHDIAFSPDNRLLAISSEDKTVRLVEAASGREIARLEHADSIFSSDLAFSPDGRFLATNTSKESTRLFEATSGREIARSEHGEDTNLSPMKPSLENFAFSPDSRILAAPGKEHLVLLLNTENGQELARLEHGRPIRGIVFSPDGRFLAITSEGDSHDRDNIGRIIETASGREIAQFRHEGRAASWPIAFSPDSRLLAIASPDGSVRLIETSSGREIARVEYGSSIKHLEFSDDGRFLATGGGKNMLVLRAEAGQEGREVARIEHDGPVWGGFSPDSRFLITVSQRTVSEGHDSVVFRVIRSDPEYVFDLLCNRAGQNLSESEWRAYIGPREPWRPTCAKWHNANETRVNAN